MTPKPIYIVDIIGECVRKTNDAVIDKLTKANSSIAQLNYQFGFIYELLETMVQWDKSQTLDYLKYPLVWLVTDFDENRGNNGADFYATVNLNIIIANFTQREYKAYERMDVNYRPILYPIYYELLHQLAKHPSISVQDEIQIPHTKTDRYFWGKNHLANNLNDSVDAIEIQNLQLKINFKTCENPKPTFNKIGGL